ncbi:MAG: hypothetical protein PHO02_04745 [Candidatus Nanoarchaeia archaeon]|nr:hypothetical protein [Candidatus Nanoarchaeia archaeon]
MNKKLLAVSILLGLMMVSAVSAVGSERIRIQPKTLPTLEISVIDKESILPRVHIPQPPRIPTKDDTGFYSYGERGAGIWGDSVDYIGVLASSDDDTGLAATTNKGYWAVWAYNRKAETTGWLGAYRTGVLGLVKDASFFAGEFLGGKGVYSENGYSTRKDGREVNGVSGSFRTTDGKRITIVNGIVTNIA